MVTEGCLIIDRQQKKLPMEVYHSTVLRTYKGQ